MSLCVVQFLPALLLGVDVEGVKTPIPEQSLMFVSRGTPGNHEKCAKRLGVRRLDAALARRGRKLQLNTVLVESAQGHIVIVCSPL